jgi:DNA/RNA-binding domain of Phe-tRNA-synthetase-like protein
MYFQHAPDIWRDFPELAAGVMAVDGIDAGADVDLRVRHYLGIAHERLGGGPESALPEIQAWRRAFSTMGLKPTQYRCASEALLRRFRKEGELPRLHPLVDLCNAVSLAFAIPIAAIDAAKVEGGIEVRRATGDERYQTFGGEIEHPEPGEVIFADDAGQAHARRWTNRQSGLSAVSRATGRVLIVSEAMHDTATEDVGRLVETLADEIGAVWRMQSRTAMLTPEDRRFEV